MVTLYMEDINQGSISAGREDSYGVTFLSLGEWHEKRCVAQVWLYQHHWPSK